MFFAASGLSLSNMTSGSKPAVWQKRSQMTRRYLDPISDTNPLSRSSASSIESLPRNSGRSGTARKISSSITYDFPAGRGDEGILVVTMIS